MFTSNDTEVKPLGFTQEIDPRFIRTMKKDLNGPISNIPQNSNPPMENPFIGTGALVTPAEEHQQKSESPKEKQKKSMIITENEPTIPLSTENAISNPPFDLPKTKFDQSPKENNVDLQMQQPIIDSMNQPEKQMPKPQPPSNGTGEKIIVAAILMLIIISLAGGGYYFWATKTPTPEQQPQAVATQNGKAEQNIPTEPKPINNPITINPVSEKYSQDKPNLLTINTNAITPVEIQGLITKTTEEIKQIKPLKPIEFVIVDENNNPIAFSRFVTLANIGLPKTLISGLDEKFSLFYFLDREFVKIGMRIDSKSQVATIAEMRNAEKDIASILGILYPENKNSKINMVFNDSTYNSLKIRYANIDQITQTSFDYTVTDKYLLIGTSKDTLRSILDKNSPSSNQ